MVHGRKWWYVSLSIILIRVLTFFARISGACDPRCSFGLVFGLHREAAAAHKRHSIVRSGHQAYSRQVLIHT
jgi:hypothetical protein